MAIDWQWVPDLKLAEREAGRDGLDPLWDLFTCYGNGAVTFREHCRGERYIIKQIRILLTRSYFLYLMPTK